MTAEIYQFNEEKLKRRYTEIPASEADAVITFCDPCPKCGGVIQTVAYWSPNGLLCQECGKEAS